ncbi:hypothetical protein [Rhodococcus sp. BE178]|uniref:hypothetical protein n=1 Tax=Rhodococcus sp. BE178 TaxID=2817737 RepID=UPI003D25054D
MILWDCMTCSSVRMAPCGSACIESGHHSLQDFRKVRIEQEKQRIEQARADREADPFHQLASAIERGAS